MLKALRALFADRCPQCQRTMQSRQDSLRVLKYCPQGHYREETYATLGVRIVYDSK